MITKLDSDIIKRTIENYPMYLQGRLEFVSKGILFSQDHLKNIPPNLKKQQTIEKKSNIKSLSSGIINYANNCYINSILQCLFNTQELYGLCISSKNYPTCLLNKSNQ